MNIAVFASTNGTDLQAIIDEKKAGNLENIDISFVFVDKKECGAAKKARNAGIPLIFVDIFDENDKKKAREDYDREIQIACEAHKIDLIVLVGWMRILSPWFVKQWPRKILNIHPSLLPKYPGMDLDVHQEVLDNGETETGMTIHYVDEGVDSGEIILQKSVQVSHEDTAETLKVKVQELEKRWYPEVIRELSKDQDLS
jgi:phosphoribosylglycinamide formyltransferase-1